MGHVIVFHFNFKEKGTKTLKNIAGVDCNSDSLASLESWDAMPLNLFSKKVL